MLLSVIAPCMNEEDGLEVFYLRVLTTLKSLCINDYEMILIDDGSTDNTWDMITGLHRRDARVKGIKLSRNFGHQAALTAGLHQARGQFVFIIDSDLQDPPELLGPMFDKMKQGFDVVYGKRRQRAGETKFKLVSASLFYRTLSKLSDIDIPKDTGDFRLINSKVLTAYNSLSESQRFTRGLIAWLGYRQTEIFYDRHPRFAGTTKYPLKKMLNFSIDALTGFSLKPLRMIIGVGILATFVSVLVFLYSASALTAICVLCSMQLICLGVVGEYVGRTFTETKKRPLYLIQDQTSEIEQSLQVNLLKQTLSARMNNESSIQ